MSIYDQLKKAIDGKSEAEIGRLKRKNFDTFCVTRVRSIATENTNLDTVTNRLIDLMQDTFLDLFDHSIALEVAKNVANKYF